MSSRPGERPRTRRQPRSAPGPHRAWVQMQERRASVPFRWLRAQRLRLLARASVERARRWHGRSAWGWTLVLASGLATALAILRIYVEFYPLSIGGFQIPPAERSGFLAGYDALTALLVPLGTTGLGYLIFVFWRVRAFRSPYRRDALRRPEELVETSGTMLGQIVGRDDLCRAIMEDLRDRGSRRPHVIVGGVGVGKTAVLVRLVTMLAQKGAVPVPLRLRDCGTTLSFRDAAHTRFVALAEIYGVPSARADRIWQQLCNDDKIVVLADGLEEALQDLGPRANERDNMIRLAIRRASKEGLPVVVASRPHTPLRGLAASMTDLEPLSEHDALLYLRRRGSNEEDERLQWIVETADISESPLYLQITDELNAAELLHHVSRAEHRDRLDTRDVDKVGLRLRLLETWVNAVVDGYLHEEVGLDAKDREATVEQLSALACAGLRMDSLEVRFSDFEVPADDELEDADKNQQERLRRQRRENELRYRNIHDELKRRLAGLHRRQDLQLAAAYGQQLGLVEPIGAGIRFPHSIMQAYLGSRLIGYELANLAYMRTALKEPGREFLLALVMYTRRTDRHRQVARENARLIVRSLRDRARKRSLLPDKSVAKLDVKTVDLYTSAAQIAPEMDSPRLSDTDPGGLTAVVADLRHLVCQTQWAKEKVIDPLALEEAKLRFVFSLGEAIRRAAEGKRRIHDDDKKAWRADVQGAYRELFEFAVCERSYAVRLAAAQEIGTGGDVSYEALRKILRFSGTLPAERNGDQPRTDAEQERADEKTLREQVIRAWLAPMLAATVTPVQEAREPEEESARAQISHDAREDLEDWLRYVTQPDPEKEFRTNVQLALAQGFKYSANWRRLNPYSHAESRAYLAEQAKSMLHAVDVWYARLTLLHALTLWSLPDASPEADADHGPQSPDILVEQWMVMKNDEAERAAKDSWTEHPFVAYAAKLCVLALESRQPERFLWIDESGVLSKTGSRLPTRVWSSRHHLWIPPSTGWSALDPRAQQLVADILVLLNLAEGGRGPAERERRLARTATVVLPSCLSKDRSPLDLVHTVGIERRRRPDAASRCAPDCVFDLCPYPLKGQQQHRAELSEAFCRRQRVILRARGRLWSLRIRATAPWQGQTKNHLRRFWEEMGARSQR